MLQLFANIFTDFISNKLTLISKSQAASAFTSLAPILGFILAVNWKMRITSDKKYYIH